MEFSITFYKLKPLKGSQIPSIGVNLLASKLVEIHCDNLTGKISETGLINGFFGGSGFVDGEVLIGGYGGDFACGKLKLMIFICFPATFVCFS